MWRRTVGTLPMLSALSLQNSGHTIGDELQTLKVCRRTFIHRLSERADWLASFPRHLMIILYSAPELYLGQITFNTRNLEAMLCPRCLVSRLLSQEILFLPLLSLASTRSSL